VRQALALSLDRVAMNEVLLQGGGEPAGGLLPNWMTGYAFLFPCSADLDRARQLRMELHQTQTLSFGYDAGDALARVIAERIVLNAKDVGITLQLAASSNVDVQLVQLLPISLDAQISLVDLAGRLGLPQPKFASESASDNYAVESALLQAQRVIPLLHVRSAVALGPRVRNWVENRDGSWHLPDVWLAAEKP
jgi:ABC-type transport system substrate-binding protein